jgi:hypothetical protein
LSACDILSARLVEELDLGKVNSHFFLTSLRIPGAVSAECDGRYTVSPLNGGEICVSNLSGDGRAASDPRDGRLETMVSAAPTGFFRSIFKTSGAGTGTSVFPTEKIIVRSLAKTALLATADGQSYEDAEFKIEVAPRSLRVVVGKGRHV